ncbi:MAG: CusA/CzcA family heavy metal efflux RND transporter, partial [Candidatus Omnitrophica bacterium]|nr:CusA/CzcA family heavy metal efflux RND transporter [Candidatus Omnitrophota bacterium]
FKALESNNANVGGSYIEHGQEQYLVRGIGLVGKIEDIEKIVIKTVKNTPIYVRDVAEVKVGPEIRTGSATLNGKEAVLGAAFMLKGENSRVVSKRVHDKIQEIRKTMPEGTDIRTVYNRTDLVNRTIHTVQKNLFEGGILVMVVLLVLLGNVRAGLIVASAIPLSMLFAITGMAAGKISGNLMSLGAIDFGLIVDGAVVMVENIIRRLSERKKSDEIPITSGMYVEEISLAAKEVAMPVVFGISIITIVYLPVLTLQGIEGKMFKPMALTVVMALSASLLLTLTLIPVLCSFFLGRHVEEKENKIMKFLHQRYAALLDRVMAHKRKTCLIAMGIVAVSVCLMPFLGSVFIPRLDEESISIQSIKLPSISLTESTKLAEVLEKVVLGFPEVSLAFTRIGTAEIATDPMGPEHSDTTIMLKDKVNDKEALIERLQKAVSVIPGMGIGFSQPIELRVNELISGVRSDVAVKIFGDDLEELKRTAGEIQRVLASIRGAKDVKAEQISGFPILNVEVDRTKIARYGLNVADVLGTIEIAFGGKSAGEVFEGVRRFDLVLRYPPEYRKTPEAVGSLLITTPAGAKIPVAELTKKIAIEEGPAQISHESSRRRVVVEANIRGRDIAGFVEEAKRAIEKAVRLPAGYSLSWGGQFENLENARRTLMIVIPLCLFLIFILLFSAFNSLKQALLVFTGIPLAMSGGIIALFLTGLPFSISAAIGFIALFGVAMLNGIVMVSTINDLRKKGLHLTQAVMHGAKTRLRPVLMTALVASLGFVPMAIAHGTGAEVQKPLAVVVIGGLISSTVLTLLLLPILYLWFEKSRGLEKRSR